MKIVFGIAAVAAIVVMINVAPSVAQSNDSEYVIVANRELSGGTINITALKEVFQREAKNWKNSGSEIIPVDLYTANGFYENLFGKSYTQMQMQWMKMRNSYSMDMPISKKDPESVKQFIAANKDAIGFLKLRDVDDRVKVVKLID